MKKILACLITFILTLTVSTSFIGCGPKYTDQDLDVDLPSDYSAEIRLGVLNQPGEKTTAEEFVKGFNIKYPNIKVTVEQIPEPYNQTLIREAATGTLSDVFWASDSVVDLMAEEDAIVNLDPYIEADKSIDLADFYEPMVLLGKKDRNPEESQYMLPRDYNKMVVYYNKQMFTDLGVALPKEDWDWEDFLDTCEQLTQKISGSEYAGGYAVDPGIGGYTFYTSLFESLGGTLFNEDGIPVLDKGIEDSLQIMQDLVKKGYVWAYGSGRDVTFQSGKLGMQFGVRTWTSVFTDEGLNFDVVPLPAMSNTPKIAAGCSGYSIYRGSKDINASWALLSYMMSVDGQNAFSSTGNCVPSRNDLLNLDALWAKTPQGINHEAFIKYPERDVVKNYYVDVDSEIRSDVQAYIGAMINDVIKGDYETPAKAISTAKNKILREIADM